MRRLSSRIGEIVGQPHLDKDYFQYVVNQEVFIWTSASTVLQKPTDVVECLLSLQTKITAALSPETPLALIAEVSSGGGRPRLKVSEDLLTQLIDMPLPVSCIAHLLGVSESTIFRRMHELGLSTRASYSIMSDAELDNAVLSIKNRLPNVGYRIVKGCLQADGHRVQWERIKESMHRVDGAGVLERLMQLGCIVRRTYCVQHPLS